MCPITKDFCITTSISCKGCKIVSQKIKQGWFGFED
jgi:hypothetical protein